MVHGIAVYHLVFCSSPQIHTPAKPIAQRATNNLPVKLPTWSAYQPPCMQGSVGIFVRLSILFAFMSQTDIVMFQMTAGEFAAIALVEHKHVPCALCTPASLSADLTPSIASKPCPYKYCLCSQGIFNILLDNIELFLHGCVSDARRTRSFPQNK
jgi:hypothetical protein